MMTRIARLGGATVALEADETITPGHQRILVSRNDPGHILATALAGDLPQVSSDEGWFVVPHTAEVDARLIALLDLCADIRRHAPGLVQLPLLLEGAPE